MDNTTRRQFLAIGAASLSGLAGCATNVGESTYESGGDVGDSDSSLPSETDSIEVFDVEEESSVLGAVIEGKMKNTSGEAQDYIQIKAFFYDSEKTRLGEAMDNSSDVPDGQTVKFKCQSTVEPEKVDTYTLKVGTTAF